MSQLRSDGTIWPWWWHKKSLSFFPCGTFCEQKSCLTEHTFSTSTFENPLSICEVKVRNICHPPESKLLRKKLYLLIQQVHSGSYGLKGWKTTESYSNRRKLSNRRMWSERTRPINYVHVRRYSEASHLCTRWLINSVSNCVKLCTEECGKVKQKGKGWARKHVLVLALQLTADRLRQCSHTLERARNGRGRPTGERGR